MSRSNWEIIVGRLNGTLPAVGTNFDKQTTAGIIGFEVFVGISFLAALLLLPRWSKRVPLRFLAVAAGVFVFELFTAPMWRNLKLGTWAYAYQQVSWILTLGWSTLILSTVVLVDRCAARRCELTRFGITIGVLTPVVFLFEALLLGLGVRRYAPEVMERLSGLGLFGAPIEALYYVPVFLSLVIGFYKYWSLVLDGVPVIPLPKTPRMRLLITTVAAALLFEVMIEPMVDNVGFPAWSCIYRDVTVIMTGFWVIVLWLAMNIVEDLLPHWDLTHRFLACLVVAGAIAVPAEVWFISAGLRVYGPSAAANFSGLTVPWTQAPLEVVFAIPLYVGLMTGFVRYMDIAIVNRRRVHELS